MQHTSKDGTPKILKECSLPLTGAGVVSQIITELAAFSVDKSKRELTLTDLAEGVTLEEVQKKTGCDFHVAETLGSF
jgi:3-oxoacid CoA-transferase